MSEVEDFETAIQVPARFETAPDLSQIRPLLRTRRGQLSRCMLPPKTISLTQRSKTIEEIWFFLRGIGQVRRKLEDHEETVDVGPGVCLTIPTGTHFQFRNVGQEPLTFVIATMPPWPGDDECVRVPDHWPSEEQLEVER